MDGELSFTAPQVEPEALVQVQALGVVELAQGRDLGGLFGWLWGSRVL